MRKISLVPYTISASQPDGKKVEVPFNVKGSLVEVLFHPSLKLNAITLLKQNILAQKILDSAEEVFLEEEEYERVMRGVNCLEGLGREAVEFIKRVTESPKINVEEAKQ